MCVCGVAVDLVGGGWDLNTILPLVALFPAMTSSVWKSRQPGSLESGAQTRISLVLYRVGKIPTWHWRFPNNPRHFNGRSESRYLSYCLAFTEESRWITHQAYICKSTHLIFDLHPATGCLVGAALKKCLLQKKSFQSFPWEKLSIGFPFDGSVVCAVWIRPGAASSFCFT